MGRLIAVSNRLPRPGDAHSGGLTVAVRNALEKVGGLWLGWSGQVRAMDGEEPVITQQRHNNVDYVSIDLTQRDQDEYYNGFANRALWPLFHNQPGLTEFARRDMAGYYRVNQTFARTLLPMLQQDDVIWVHDYHLIPLAAELRALGVRNRIGFFLHIPWPTAELLVILPNHARLAANLTAYDLVGFQTRPFLNNFLDYLRDEAGAEIERDGMVDTDGHRMQAAVFPISIDTAEFARFAAQPPSPDAERLATSLNGRDLALSVDRLDYSKGIPQRLEAYGRFLELYPQYRRHVTALQIAPTTRETIPEYADLNREVAEVAGRINGQMGEIDWVPIRYVNLSLGRETLAGLYRAARVGLVTPLRDGMNLVAKEYVAAQDPDNPGVLILSRFAGAAHELAGALIVNPYDIDGMAHCIASAFAMPLDERKSRFEPMMRHLQTHDVHRWCVAFLAELAGKTYADTFAFA